MSAAKVTSGTSQKQSYETVIVKGITDPAIGQRIRVELVNKFDGCWFFVYNHDGTITATNDFGGRLVLAKIDALLDHAKFMIDAIYVSSNSDDISARPTLGGRSTSDENVQATDQKTVSSLI